MQYYAQYYNNPNDPGSERISADKFQYYEPRQVTHNGESWYIKGMRLNVYASIDFAFSLGKRADFSSIVVIGISADNDIYILDIDRFKTDRISEYYRHVKELHSKWDFKKLRAEVTVAQKIIVNDIKDSAKKEGLRLSVDEFRPVKSMGSKEERISAALEPRYDNLQMWHYKGGYTNILEEELTQSRPAHDDIKDALASAVEIAIKPSQKRSSGLNTFKPSIGTNSRFGGVAFR